MSRYCIALERHPQAAAISYSAICTSALRALSFTLNVHPVKQDLGYVFVHSPFAECLRYTKRGSPHGLRNEVSLSKEVALKLSRVALVVSAMKKSVLEWTKELSPHEPFRGF